MDHWLEQYASWEGRAEGLAELCNVLLNKLQLRKPGVPLNEQLVRNYVQRNLIDRPRKQGRDAFYGFRHLLQILATRVLSQVMSLTAAAEKVRGMSEAELLNIIPKNVGQQESPQLQESSSLDLETEKAIVLVKEKLGRRRTYRAVPENEEWVPPKGRPSRTIDVTSWCRVTLDEEIFASQPEEAIKMLIRVIASAVDADHQKLSEKYARTRGEQ